MSPVYDAVRAVADAVLAAKCSARISSSLVAAAVRAAVSLPPNDVHHEKLHVDDLVDDRLNMIRPVLHAQAVHGLQTGLSPHSARGLVPDVDCLRANAARHVGFDREDPLSSVPARQLKNLQRGGNTKKELPIEKEKIEAKMQVGKMQTNVKEVEEEATEQNNAIAAEFASVQTIATDAESDIEQSTATNDSYAASMMSRIVEPANVKSTTAWPIAEQQECIARARANAVASNAKRRMNLG